MFTQPGPQEFHFSDGKLTPADEGSHFTLRPLDFYGMQEVLGIDATDAQGRLRAVLRLGVIKVEGDAAKAKAFVAAPAHKAGSAVFDWLWAESMGN